MSIFNEGNDPHLSYSHPATKQQRQQKQTDYLISTLTNSRTVPLQNKTTKTTLLVIGLVDNSDARVVANVCQLVPRRRAPREKQTPFVKSSENNKTTPSPFHSLSLKNYAQLHVKQNKL